MREVLFLKQNRDKWREFEVLLKDPQNASPDKLADLFVQISDDLSYARTFYPKSRTEKYLNRIAGEVYLAIFRNRKEKRNRLVDFFRFEVPGIVIQSRNELIAATAVFFIAISIGVISSIYDDSFIRTILSDGYVEMTIENIKNGNPTGVYQSEDMFSMFIRIAYNNLKVEFSCFVAGILFSIGSAYVIASNGIMVGAFFSLFAFYNVQYEAWLNILIHGTIELLTIILAGAAGFIIGNSILFPKAYTRYESFIMGSKKGLKLVLGITPFTVLAALLESFVTRYSNMSIILNWFIVLLSLVLMIGYWVLYPYKIKKRMP